MSQYFQEESPRPPRLGREATPLVLPTSFRVKRMQRSKKRRILLSAAAAGFVLFVVVGFLLRDRIQERFLPYHAPVMIPATPSQKGTTPSTRF